jgi:hypothetical protein
MPQPHKRDALTVPLHLFCSNCSCPMHLTTAHVTADGTEKIRFVCDQCATETVREHKTFAG